MSDDASKFLGGILGDISSRFAIGGGIILMEIAHQEGYIEIDWSKITRKLDKVTDKVEEAVTGQEKTWVDKAERFVDRKLIVLKTF
ncbi:FUN14 domain-containing protein 1B [Eumeta japonica]|uniref:FUN14 domain-containing protein 1B n=1 Tax=Eumeta variegata TaxID=151549 RepID=A0A4C1SLZ0_EUMVA|nr:FUN14 domain-containing protein 1B [Eumeta japonica]